MRERGRRRPNRGRGGWDAGQGGVSAQGEEKGGQGEMGFPGETEGQPARERTGETGKRREGQGRKEGGVCSPGPKHKGREGTPPPTAPRSRLGDRQPEGAPEPGGLAAR